MDVGAEGSTVLAVVPMHQDVKCSGLQASLERLIECCMQMLFDQDDDKASAC